MQSILAIVAVFIWGIMNVIKKHKEEIFVVEMESKRVSASAFTLMLSHVPRDVLRGTDEEIVRRLTDIFKKYGSGINSLFSYDVVKVNIARPLFNES